MVEQMSVAVTPQADYTEKLNTGSVVCEGDIDLIFHLSSMRCAINYKAMAGWSKQMSSDTQSGCK